MWLSEALHDPNFYEWTSFAVGETPVAFYLFDEIAHHQSLLRREVTSQWLKLLERPFEIKEIKPEAAQKCREKYLDHLLILAKLDHAGHILRYFEERVGAMDSSLILYFIRSVCLYLHFQCTRQIVSDPPTEITAHQHYGSPLPRRRCRTHWSGYFQALPYGTQSVRRALGIPGFLWYVTPTSFLSTKGQPLTMLCE